MVEGREKWVGRCAAIVVFVALVVLIVSFQTEHRIWCPESGDPERIVSRFLDAAAEGDAEHASSLLYGDFTLNEAAFAQINNEIRKVGRHSLTVVGDQAGTAHYFEISADGRPIEDIIVYQHRCSSIAWGDLPDDQG
jgi:hypothetical protein